MVSRVCYASMFEMMSIIIVVSTIIYGRCYLPVYPDALRVCVNNFWPALLYFIHSSIEPFIHSINSYSMIGMWLSAMLDSAGSKRHTCAFDLYRLKHQRRLVLDDL